MLKEYNDMEVEIKNLKTQSSFGLSYKTFHRRFQSINKTMSQYRLKCRKKIQKVKIQKV